MGLFSGDGAGTAARLLKKCGAIIIGGLHVKMPDCICDVKLLKYSLSKNKQIISDTDNKLKIAAQHMQQGMIPNDGLNILDHIAGLFGQRLWFYKKTQQYSDQLKINSNCIGCGLCTQHCPMNNLMLNQGKALAKDHCTMCYRCINQCPQKAITLLGKKVIVQHSINEYK